jgi:hypothetical protein
MEAVAAEALGAIVGARYITGPDPDQRIHPAEAALRHMQDIALVGPR